MQQAKTIAASETRLRPHQQIADAGRGAEQFRHQRDLPANAIGDAQAGNQKRRDQRQRQLEEAAQRAAGQACAEFVEIGIDLAETGDRIDQAERQNDRGLDEQHRRRRNLEPDHAEDGPADRREAVEECQNAPFDDAFEDRRGAHRGGQRQAPSAMAIVTEAITRPKLTSA